MYEHSFTPKGLAVVLLYGKKGAWQCSCTFQQTQNQKGGDCGTHGSSRAGDNGAVMKMLSVNPLSTFSTDPLETRKKKHVFIEKLA